MTKLPSVTPKKLVKVLRKQGFYISRQTGSHVRLLHSDGRATTVAMHNRDLPKGTLRAILKQADISVEDFIKFL